MVQLQADSTSIGFEQPSLRPLSWAVPCLPPILAFKHFLSWALELAAGGGMETNAQLYSCWLAAAPGTARRLLAGSNGGADQ